MHYYLSLGANLGERERTLRQAITYIEQQIGPVLRCSSYFYSEPWGFVSSHAFCNICCCVESSLPPHEVLHATQAIERSLGRTHKSLPPSEGSLPAYSDRLIDIDIIRVFDGDKEINIHTDELTIPHPLWSAREFVRVPLEEIIQ